MRCFVRGEGAVECDVEAELVFVGPAGAGRGDSMGEAVRGKIALVLEGGATRLERLIAARRAGSDGVRARRHAS